MPGIVGGNLIEMGNTYYKFDFLPIEYRDRQELNTESNVIIPAEKFRYYIY
jgi:hypothetical protein